MADLAELGLRIRSEDAVTAADNLDELTLAAGRAETAEERLAVAARGTGAAMRSTNIVIRDQERMMRASRDAGINLSRQFADIGVTAAMGMNPLMILIQQGPQLADAFQMAASQGVGFSMAMRGVWASLAPILVVLVPLATAVGAVASAFGLLHRELSKGYPKDITDGLGLTEEQLKRVEGRTVTFGHTVQATFNVIGKHIMDGPVGEALNWLGGKFSEIFDFITRVVFEGTARQAGMIIGTYKTIQQVWSNLPAVFGDIMLTAAQRVVDGVVTMINTAGAAINAYIRATQPLLDKVLPDIPTLDRVVIENQFAGAGAAAGAAWRENVTSEYEKAKVGLRAIAAEIRDEAVRLAVEDALKQAGDPNAASSRSGGLSEREKAIRETLDYIKALKDQAAAVGLNAIQLKQMEINERALAAVTPELRAEVEKYGAVLIEKMKWEVASTRAAEDRLEMLRLELSLIGASNMQRSVALAQLAEEQRLRAAGVGPADAAFGPSVEAARAVAAQTELNIQAQDQYNLAMEYQLDLARQIDDHARSASRGLAEAFGEQGRALGDLLTAQTAYRVEMERLAKQEKELSDANLYTADQRAMVERDRAQAQIQNYGDMASAAKNFFKEGSDGYQLMQAAEMAFRLFQFAMSAQAIAQDGVETAASIANAGSRAAASAAAGAARMFESLGPLGFPAVAAMLAVLAAVGMSAFGGSGGKGGSSSAPTGSVDRARGLQSRSDQAREAAAGGAARETVIRVVPNDDRFDAYVDTRTEPQSTAAYRASVTSSRTLIPAEQARRDRFRMGQTRR